MRVDRSGRIHPRLSRANHFRILRALWEEDPLERLRRVRVPTLVIGARTEHEDHGLLQAKEQAAAVVKSIGGNVRFTWIESIHDVPLQRPAELARLIERHVRGVGS
jgi:pimeloyl-ACP methyl ester carboxylesterase